MKLYWCPKTRAARALWLLEEAALSYELVNVDVRNPDKIADKRFFAASPMGKVPALEDGETRLADSAAIALYVADRYPDAGLAPAISDPLRGPYLYWMIYTPGVIEPAMAEKMSGSKPNRGAHGWGDFDTMISTWEKALAPGPWILGEKFSAADVLLGSSAVFLRMFGIMPDSPVLTAYADRCLARPAYAKAMRLDEEAA